MQLKFILFFNLFFLILFFQLQAWSAACCGGGFAAPTIISGDDKAQITSSLSTTEVVIDNVDSQGIWRKWDSHQQVKTFKIDIAHIFLDRFQAGFSVPVIERRHESTSYSGLGDVSTSLGYEYLPDWDYNPWRPKGIGFIQVTLPTGKSRADSEVGGLDSRGNGFWSLGVGTLLTKNWTKLDGFVSVEAHRSKSKDISNSQFTGKVQPGYGGNLGLGLGYNLSDYRIGSAVTWTYEDVIKTLSTNTANSGSIERYATAALSLSYMYSDDWSGTVNYTDQTIVGSPVNTSLGRGIALLLQRKWGR